MDIAIELGLVWGETRGFDVYCRGLVEGLAEADAENAYTLFAYFFRDHAAKAAHLPRPDKPNFRLEVPRWPERVVNALEGRGVPVIASLFARPGRFAVYHSLVGRLPKLPRGTATVVTVYDLMPQIFYKRALAEGRDPGFPDPGHANGEAARRATRVVTISRHTKDDLVREYGIDPAKVTPILLGADPAAYRPQTPETVARARTRYGLPPRFALLVGPFEWRRNHEGALRALAALRREGKALDLGLALAGKPNAHRDSLLALARSLGLESDCKALGFVPAEDLPAVYAAAELFLHPEHYDGYSLQVVEAMACGTPVVTSTRAALPEAAGGAGLLVDPDDDDAIARAVLEVLEAPGLRPRLVEKGLAWAKSLSWKSVAAKTLAVYREASGAAS